MRIKHTQDSEAPMSVCVGHALVHGGSVATRRAATSGREVGEEAHYWPGKLERNRSNLDQIGSKTPQGDQNKGKGND